MLETLAEDLRQTGELDLSECFIDGTFIVAKKGLKVGKTKRGKGTKLMAEVTLVRKTLVERFVDDKPERLIGDKAYDSDRSTRNWQK